MAWTVVLLALLAHPNSLTFSSLTVEGREVRLELRCQALSLFEVIGGIDADGDGFLSRSETEARASDVLAYTFEHYRLFAGDAPDPERQLTLVAGEVAPAPPAPGFLSVAGELVVVSLTFRAEDRFEALTIVVDLFRDTSPDHRDICEMTWNGEPTVSNVFTAAAPTWGWPPPPTPGLFQRSLKMGCEHIITGWDHIAFLMALLFGSRGFKSLAWTVTAFTVAHSLTLALASLDVVQVPQRFVEICIALSIAYVGADNLLHPAARGKWIEAFVFGLVHGLGFAGFLGQSLLGERSKALALVGFNLGVEGGQLLIVAVAVTIFSFLPRDAPSDQARFLVPRIPRRIGSGLVVLLGLYWFAQRAGFA